MSLSARPVIYETTRSIAELITGELAGCGYRGLRVILEPPRKEVVEAQYPALSIYLRQVEQDDDSPNAGSQYLDGGVWRTEATSLRLDYVIAVWAREPKEEQLLFSLTLLAIIDNPVLTSRTSRGDDAAEEQPLILSRRLDDEGMSRLWTSLGHPQRPAIQCWTSVSIASSRIELAAPLVRERELRVARRVSK